MRQENVSVTCLSFLFFLFFQESWAGTVFFLFISAWKRLNITEKNEDFGLIQPRQQCCKKNKKQTDQGNKWKAQQCETSVVSRSHKVGLTGQNIWIHVFFYWCHIFPSSSCDVSVFKGCWRSSPAQRGLYKWTCCENTTLIKPPTNVIFFLHSISCQYDFKFLRTLGLSFVLFIIKWFLKKNKKIHSPLISTE